MAGFLHRNIWQRLPRGWRRAAMVEVAGLVHAASRRGASSHGKATPITVAGTLSSASGLGEGARLCYRALAHAGLDPRSLDLSRWLKADIDIPDFPHRPAQPGEGGSMIVHVNPFPLPLAMVGMRRHARGKRIVGNFAWELPRPPAIWGRGMRYVDEVWVPSRFTAEALEPIVGARRLRILPYPIAIDDRFAATGAAASSDGASGGPFTVLTLFNMRSSFERKNPLATIEAFRRAFGSGKDARLVVKVVNGASHPAAWRKLIEAARAPNIRLIDGALSSRDIDALYIGADVVVSLHRAEGFGLLAAEAMLAGRAVVATDFSGTRDFLDRTNSIPVPYRLAPAHDPQGEYEMPSCLWADPDVEAAADALRLLRADAGFRRSLGAKARADALRLFDPMRYAEAVRDALDLG